MLSNKAIMLQEGEVSLERIKFKCVEIGEFGPHKTEERVERSTGKEVHRARTNWHFHGCIFL